MKPVVKIERTVAGDAFRYSRYVDGKSDYIVETPPVAVGKPPETLCDRDVELFRTNPKEIIGER